MLSSLYPAASQWRVVYHSNHYLVGCDVPKDVKVTNKHVDKTIQVFPKRIDSVWVQWEKEGFTLVCKLWKDEVKRAPVKTLENGDTAPRRIGYSNSDSAMNPNKRRREE
jgi:hypothetical protein